MRRGEAAERSRRTGTKIVDGRAVISKAGAVRISVGGELVTLSPRLLNSVRDAANDPKNGRSSLYVSVDAPPPSRLVKIPKSELARIRAAARDTGVS